jgi:hypothetical protein
MPVDVGQVIESTNGRTDAVYLAVIIIVFCGLLLSGFGFITLKLWKELRHEIAIERNTMKFALESISVTNLSVQQMLSTIHLTKVNVTPDTPEICTEYLKQSEQLSTIQENQRQRLETLFQLYTSQLSKHKATG